VAVGFRNNIFSRSFGLRKRVMTPTNAPRLTKNTDMSMYAKIIIFIIELFIYKALPVQKIKYPCSSFSFMEEVDVVDAHDNVVGKAKREEAHRKGLLHRVVFVMLFDADGRLYVQQRSLKKDLYPGFFEGSLSGHVLSGESFQEAAERELHEELGVCVSPRHLKDVVLFGFHDDEERVLVRLFAVKDFKLGIEPDTEGEVKSGKFPTEAQSFAMDESILAGLK
jgi:8-oxo-dGTP pyrophosphatase MutT (NUDIX family)